MTVTISSIPMHRAQPSPPQLTVTIPKYAGCVDFARRTNAGPSDSYFLLLSFAVACDSIARRRWNLPWWKTPICSHHLHITFRSELVYFPYTTRILTPLLPRIGLNLLMGCFRLRTWKSTRTIRSRHPLFLINITSQS